MIDTQNEQSSSSYANAEFSSSESLRADKPHFMSLQNFLENKPLFYDEINLHRMPNAYAQIKDKLTIPKVIHVVGTNGKGTTGRFISLALAAQGFIVGHYSSPHVLEFNERIWLNGSNVDNSTLEQSHKILFELLGEELSNSLTYFEYTTFLALVTFASCEWVVLEAGLGGEYDATNVFPSELSVITPIGIDHQSFLGNTLEEIALTKLRSINFHAVIAEQAQEEVLDIANDLAKENGYWLETSSSLLRSDDKKMIRELSDEYVLGEVYEQNLSTAIASLRALNLEPMSFTPNKPFGRLTVVAQNVVVDVGHNPLAASAIVKTLTPQRFTLIYNSFDDKDIEGVLKEFKPLCEAVEILVYENERLAKKERIENAAKELNIECSEFTSIDDNKVYLVFGSFSVLENFVQVIG